MQARKRVSISLALAVLAALPAAAQAGSVSPNGTLTASTSTTTVQNDLVTPAGSTSGFSFASSTGSFSSIVSNGGYYYADYLINVNAATAESVAVTLNNSGGVSNLAQRIYGYTGSFLGDSPAGSTIFQAWGANTTVSGTTLSYIAPSSLPAGLYVLELRGTTMGAVSGTLSLTPVPEPTEAALLLAGLAVMGATLRRRRAA